MIKSLQQKQQSGSVEGARAAAPLVNGRSLAMWTAEAVPAVEGAGPAPLATRTIEGVALKNGTTITLGRSSNGGKSVRFERVEIIPADGAGAPLVFRSDLMRAGGPRGVWSLIQFPGADGTYTLKVAYVNDPDGKATFAVSVRDPKPPTPAPAPAEKK
jgi:hypothetical protein